MQFPQSLQPRLESHALQGLPLANAKAQLKQGDAGRQTTTTDEAGCHRFKTIRSGEAFKTEIVGPVVP